MSPVITLPKKKYEALEEKAKAYENLIKAISRGGFFAVPPIKKSIEIIKAFKETGLYNKKFLGSLEKGLRRSDYFV
ncbi:MAG: hypothetical protein AAB556_01435 [Patescibacteria group bacterium]